MPTPNEIVWLEDHEWRPEVEGWQWLMDLNGPQGSIATMNLYREADGWHIEILSATDGELYEASCGNLQDLLNDVMDALRDKDTALYAYMNLKVEIE